MSMRFTADEFDAIWDCFDKSHDGRVDRDELTEFVIGHQLSEVEGAALASVRRVDASRRNYSRIMLLFENYYSDPPVADSQERS